MVSLGNLYLQGRGIPRNFERGAELLKKAVLQGGMRAQFMLAACHHDGIGVAKDYLEARRLYKLASAQGHPDPQGLLHLLEEDIRTKCPLLGKRVKITGTSRADLNGRIGVTRSFDEAAGRCVVRLHAAGAKKPGSTPDMKVRPRNLKLT